MGRYQYVDVSAVGNSGKSAVSDLLSEFRGVYMPEYRFEFDLFRLPNGLLDFRRRLVSDWSPIRSHYAVKEFSRIIDMTGRDPRPWDVAGLMRSTGQRLDRRFHGQYRKLLQHFVNSFVRIRYVAEWDFDEMQTRPELRLLRKLIRHSGGRRYLTRNVFVAESGPEFDVKTQTVIEELFNLIVPSDTQFVGLHNSFEPYNPLPALDMMGNARQITVVRDPRDIYVSGLTPSHMREADRKLLPFDNDGINKSFLSTQNIREFVQRMRIFYEKLYQGDDPRILRLQFEDVVLNYECTIRRLCDFLKISPAEQVWPRSRFVPEKSAVNVGIWRQYSRQEECAFIARELSEFLYER